MFLRAAKQRPEAPLLIHDYSMIHRRSGPWSYGKTEREARRISRLLCKAYALSSATLAPAVRVAAFYGQVSPFMHAALLATWLTQCGGGDTITPALIRPGEPAESLIGIFGTMRPSILVTAGLHPRQVDALKGSLPNSTLEVVIELGRATYPDLYPKGVYVMRLQGATAMGQLAEPLPSEPAVILFTSGTTASDGGSKTVLLPHTAISLGLMLDWLHPNERSSFVVMNLHGLQGIDDLMDLGLALCGGGCLLLVPWDITGQPSVMFDAIRALRPTVLQGAPGVLQVLADLYGQVAPLPGGSIKWIITTGEPLPPHAALTFGKMRGRGLVASSVFLLDIYGATEFSNLAYRYLPLGPGVRWPPFTFRDPEAAMVADDQELIVFRRTPSRLFLRYLNESAQRGEAKAMLPVQAYRSGDAAQVRGDGTWDLIGRLYRPATLLDEFRVDLDGLERAVEGVELVQAAVALVYPTRHGGTVGSESAGLLVYVQGKDASIEAIRQRVVQFLPPVAGIQVTYRRLVAIPRRAHGKKDRSKLHRGGGFTY